MSVIEEPQFALLKAGHCVPGTDPQRIAGIVNRLNRFHQTLMIDHALLYSSKWDFAVFPVHWIREDSSCSCNKRDCRSAGKHPLPRDGFKSASKDAEQIRRWWARYPQANIGIATGRMSGIIVLDVDPRHGGFDSLARFSLPELAATMKCRTGGGGEHYYFRAPAKADVRNSAGKLGAGLDVRGEGGYVVAPPSNHLMGVYEWEKWDTLAEWPFGRGNPSWLPVSVPREKTIRTPARPHGQGQAAAPTVATIGSRNSTLASMAGAMRQRGFSPGAILQALLIENQARCEPPLETAEVRQIARSIGRYEFRESGASVESKEKSPARNSPDSQGSQNLTVWDFNSFLNYSFQPKETICFGAGAGDVAMVAARTNGGKSTLLRNCLLKLATGRSFPPFVPETAEQKPKKVLLLDFEADNADLQSDLRTMTANFSSVDHDLLAENFYLVPRAMIKGELFQLNDHFELVRDLSCEHGIEVIVVDNISSAFSLTDENSNAEVTARVVKPLAKLAFMTKAALIYAHHIGKVAEGSRDDVYKSRGASALACLSKSVFHIAGRVDLGEAVDVACVKQKQGENFAARFILDRETRWFLPVEGPPSVKKPTNYDLIVAWVRENSSAEKPVKTREIVAAFPKISRASVMEKLKEAIAAEDLVNPKYGLYAFIPKCPDV